MLWNQSIIIETSNRATVKTQGFRKAHLLMCVWNVADMFCEPAARERGGLFTSHQSLGIKRSFSSRKRKLSVQGAPLQTGF